MELYRFNFDCGRQGSLNGMFAVDARGRALLDALIASRRELYFGEVLGKHSEIVGPLDPGDITRVDATPEEVSIICRILTNTHIDPNGRPWNTIDGFNPLETADEHVDDYNWSSHNHYAKLLAWCSGK